MPASRDRTPLLPVTVFTLGYLLVASVLSIAWQNWEFVFYVVVVLIAGLTIAGMHKRVNFSHGLLWGLSLWGFIHMLGGLVGVPESWPINGDKHVLYSLWLIPDILKYDHVVHAYGFGIATWACWQAVRGAVHGQIPTVGVLILCALAGQGLGALNEVIEFLITVILPDTNIGGYLNTSLDLVANLVGSVVAASWIRLATAETTGEAR